MKIEVYIPKVPWDHRWAWGSVQEEGHKIGPKTGPPPLKIFLGGVAVHKENCSRGGGHKLFWG